MNHNIITARLVYNNEHYTNNDDVVFDTNIHEGLNDLHYQVSLLENKDTNIMNSPLQSGQWTMNPVDDTNNKQKTTTQQRKQLETQQQNQHQTKNKTNSKTNNKTNSITQ
jgi:hypothetical protein